MAKKGLAALANKQINSTAQSAQQTKAVAPDDEIPTQTSTGAKRGRPAVITAPDEVNFTVKLSASLIRRMRQFILDNESDGYGKITQKEIVTKAIGHYLDCCGIF